ncbi:MAG TPA: hypothetical protein VI076_05640 [Actinopolymorphaceae bacterium]
MATIVLAATFGLAALTACGGEEPATNASGDKPAEETTAQTEPSAEPTQEATEPEESTEPEAKPDPASDPFCAEVQKMGLDFLNNDTSGDLGAIADKYDKLAAAAPSDIKPDWETMAKSIRIVAEEQAKLKKDPTSVDTEKMQKASQEMQTAVKKVTDDMKTRCMGVG